ncbi:dynamin family protein [Neisseriaceae bacterium CLB008]
MSTDLFSIAVVATMSSGKTTLINSILGIELLYSANEATTAKITAIRQDNDLLDFQKNGFVKKARSKKITPVKHINKEILVELNQDVEVSYIEVRGPYQNLVNMTQSVMIYDSPGPNNSQDKRHQVILERFISDTKLDLIIYVLNATQIGIEDDKRLLEFIKKVENNTKHIMFVINKVDCLDEEKGENAATACENAKRYLSQFNLSKFDKAAIIPMSSLAILTASKYLNGHPMSRSERHLLVNVINSMDIGQELTFSDFQSISIENKQEIFKQLISSSGLLEFNIQLVNYQKGLAA